MKSRPTTARTGRPTTAAQTRTPRAPAARPVRDVSRTAPTPPVSASPNLIRSVSRWIADGKAQGWSDRTLKNREQLMARFAWWLEHEAAEPLLLSSIDPAQIRAFLAYVRDPAPAGRWGNDKPAEKARPSTVHTYHGALRAFANFILAEGLVDEAPLKNVKAPKVPKDQIQPFTDDQVQLLLNGVRQAKNPARDEAIVLLLIDTGMRVSEMCGLSVADADRGAGELRVIGKGNKERMVPVGTKARRALWRYLEAERQGGQAEEPLFTAGVGRYAGGGLTKWGIHNLIAEAGKAAGISGVRCSPHTCRHTFCINFLRNGGDLFRLQLLVGHEDLTTLRRYVALAQADLVEAHRQASPIDRMKLK